MNRREIHSWKRLWLAPLFIAVLSLVGLLSALSGDGVWDILSWFSLGVPCLAIFYYLIKGLRQ